MSKKNNKSNVETKPVETKEVETNDIVLVRVIKNFNDATDNNNFVAAGKNNFYRTNKERADMLVKAGYCEYEDGTEVDNVITDDNSDSNITDDSNVDNGTTDDTNDVTTDNNSDDTNASDNIDDNNNANDNTDNNSNPNE